MAIEEKIVSVLGLLIKCPLEKPIDECPAKSHRHLSFNEKYTLVGKMSEEDLDAIISTHKKCIRLREKELFGKGFVN